MSAGEVFREWGSTPEERVHPLPCDDLLPDATAHYHRAVDVQAPPAVVFRTGPYIPRDECPERVGGPGDVRCFYPPTRRGRPPPDPRDILWR